MARVQLFWDPAGFELDTLGSQEYLEFFDHDGDTPQIAMPVRMLSIDSAEKYYGKPTAKYDEELGQLAMWMQEGKTPMHDRLIAYLVPKLATGQAGTLQQQHGERASQELKQLLQTKLTKPSGKKRELFLRASNEVFDDNKRLLLYIAPNYTLAERETMTRRERATFNLLMIQSGWAAPFLIYPSLPQYVDLVMFHEDAQAVAEQGRGAWADPLMLTGYEFRMCVKLYEITKQLVAGKKLSTTEKYAWITRYCADMMTRELFEPQDYYQVKPWDRVFIWPKDVSEAVARLNLMVAELR